MTRYSSASASQSTEMDTTRCVLPDVRFVPQRSARAAPEPGRARLDRALQRFAIGVRQRQHGTGRGVGDDDRREPSAFQRIGGSAIIPPPYRAARRSPARRARPFRSPIAARRSGRATRPARRRRRRPGTHRRNLRSPGASRRDHRQLAGIADGAASAAGRTRRASRRGRSTHQQLARAAFLARARPGHRVQSGRRPAAVDDDLES